jgi:hypothetical protein
MPCFVSYNKFSPLYVFETTEVHGFNPDCSCNDCQGDGAFCPNCDWTYDSCSCSPPSYDFDFDDDAWNNLCQ